MAPKPNNKNKPQPRRIYGKPEPTSVLPRVFGWLFIVVGLVVIGWLIILSPKQKKLTCDNTPYPSLLRFGSCHTEED